MKVLLTAVVAVALLAFVPSAAHAGKVPTNEGGDVSPCVTRPEVLLIHVGQGARKIRRIVDTSGVKVNPTRLVHILEQLHAHGEAHPPIRYREVRSYPLCNDTEGLLLVEFDTRSDKAVTLLYR